MILIGGGYALWRGGWISEQFEPCVRLTSEIQKSEPEENTLRRKQSVFARLADSATITDGVAILYPAVALADGILNLDHRVIQPDEIETSFLKGDHITDLVDALMDMGCEVEQAVLLAEPYQECLDGRV
jgi:hypothetical protein